MLPRTRWNAANPSTPPGSCGIPAHLVEALEIELLGQLHAVASDELPVAFLTRART
jgi:hypothetical protein